MTDRNLESLIAAITETGKSLEEGRAIYEGLVKIVRRMRITLWVAIIGLAADLILSIAFGFILHSQSDLNQDVRANQVAIHNSECDLNTLFIKADTPAARDRSPDKAMYDNGYHSLYLQRVQLDCQPPITEPVRPPS